MRGRYMILQVSFMHSTCMKIRMNRPGNADIEYGVENRWLDDKVDESKN